MLVAVICFPIDAITLPDGSELSPSMDTSEYSEWTKISDAESFSKIVPGGKYYLAADIDLTAEGVSFKTLTGGNNTKSPILLDGCGYTVKTNKMLIDELPGESGGCLLQARRAQIRLRSLRIQVLQLTMSL